MLNTDIFTVMMQAYGWKPAPAAPPAAPARPRTATNQ
jgi:hypothetical protein